MTWVWRPGLPAPDAFWEQEEILSGLLQTDKEQNDKKERFFEGI